MEIREFLEQWAGLWFSQRTSYWLNQAEVDNSKSELTVELLEIADPELIQLCQSYEFEPSLSIGGIKVSWDNAVDWGKPKQIGSNILILLKNGEFLQSSCRGEYALGKDEALTLMVNSPDLQAQERVVFASPNLKLRTVLTTYPDGRTHTAFYTEIRKITATS